MSSDPSRRGPLRGALQAVAFLALVVGAAWWSGQGLPSTGAPASPEAAASQEAPGSRGATASADPQVAATWALIERGGPFPHRQDGGVFHNREERLPDRPAGYYREYTVETPGSGDRGARRLVTGGDPPEVVYFTDDHYGSFRVLELP